MSFSISLVTEDKTVLLGQAGIARPEARMAAEDDKSAPAMWIGTAKE